MQRRELRSIAIEKRTPGYVVFGEVTGLCEIIITCETANHVPGAVALILDFVNDTKTSVEVKAEKEEEEDTE